jgi:O-antigen/teichoic acid export membrane protein
MSDPDRPPPADIGASDFAEAPPAGSDPEHAPILIARRAGYGLLTQAVDKVLPVAILLYLARALEPDAFGVYSFLVAYLAFFQIVSDYSIDTVLVRTMSQDPAARDALLQAGLGLKLALALASVVVSVALVGVASDHQVPLTLMLVASLSLPTALGGAYRAWHRSRLEIAALFFQATLRAVLLAAGVVVAVTHGRGLLAIFAAMAFANLLTFAIVALALRGAVRPIVRFDLALWRRLASGIVPLMVNAFAVTVSLRIGQILLMSMRGPVEVGQLAAAARVTEAFALLPEALMISVYPLMAGLHDRDQPALLVTAQRSTRYLVAATGVPVVLCAGHGSEIMRLLFGPAFAGAGDILSLLAFTALLGATGIVNLNLLVATHRERALSRVAVAFAAIGSVAAWLAIDAYGAIGAAGSALVVSAASQATLVLLPSTRTWVRASLGAAVRPIAAVLVAIAVARLAGLEGWTGVAVTLVIYVAGVAVLRVFGAEEWRLLRSLAPGRR